jgi:hypothetical protein
MTTLTVNIENEADLAALQETLDKLGLPYGLSAEKEYIFTKEQISGFVKTQQDFIEGKATARDWRDIEKDLDSAFD